jgi:hypothetical protein
LRSSGIRWCRPRSLKSFANVTLLQVTRAVRLNSMAILERDKDVELATETLHRSIDSGRRLFEAGERLLDDLDRFWRQTANSPAWKSPRHRFLLIGVAAGVCVALAMKIGQRTQ